MPEETNETNEDMGKVIFSWKFSEFYKYQRGGTWYFWIIVISLGIIIWSILAEQNYLFPLILILAAAIIIFQNRRKPQTLEFKIREDGIEVGKNRYLYRDMKNFWIIYRPPEVKTLYFDFKSSLRATLPISLEDQNPIEIRKVLKRYLEEDIEKEEEPASDTIGRALKI